MRRLGWSMNASVKASHRSRCTLQSGQATQSSSLLKSLEDTKDSIRSEGHRCDQIRPEVNIPVIGEQISLLKFCIKLVKPFLFRGCSVISCCFLFQDFL